MHSSIFKAMARRALQGKWQKTAWIVFVGTLISGGIQLNAGEIKPSFQVNLEMMSLNVLQMLLIGLCVCLLLALIIGSVVNVGMYNLGGKLLDGEEPRMKMLFPRGLVWRALFMNVLRALVVYAAMIIAAAAALFTRSQTVLAYGLSIAYIPAFFLSYCYAMADYLLLVNPKMGPVRALKESRTRMKGFKSDLFWLELSFIGWSLLSMVPPLIIMSMLVDISQTVSLVAGFAATLVCGIFVTVYEVVAKTAFFREVDNPDDGYAKKRAEQQAHAQQAAQEPAPEAAPEPEPEPVSPVVDEDAAREFFLEYECSLVAMRKAGVLEEYVRMNVDSSMEQRWMRDYMDQLIRRFDRDAETIVPILRFAAEYAHEEMVDRALMRVDRHVRQQTLPPDEILGMAGRFVAMISAGVFDENPNYIARKKEQISGIVDRLEEMGGDGETIAMLRNML